MVVRIGIPTIALYNKHSRLEEWVNRNTSKCDLNFNPCDSILLSRHLYFSFYLVLVVAELLPIPYHFLTQPILCWCCPSPVQVVYFETQKDNCNLTIHTEHVRRGANFTKLAVTVKFI